MSSTPWQLQEHQAHLSLGELSGAIDLRAPSQGLKLRRRSELVTALAVELPTLADAQAASGLEAWVRGTDLVATYSERQDRHRRGQVYLRAQNYLHAGSAYPLIELIASVQTSLLDSDPTLNVRSHIAARDVLRISDIEMSRASPIEWNDREQHFHAMPEAIACFIFRLADGQSSYIEMVHPADFNQSVLRKLPGGETELSHRLFAGRLEKGVILRSRVRAIFVPSENDLALASACYADFAASEPVLTV
jgi:hypothetical protein